MIKNRHAWLLRGLLILATVVVPSTVLANVESDYQDFRRHCIGLLWCTEQSAEGRSVDGLLWLYSAEERGSYSRLAIRPLYSMEEDPTRDLRRRSFLWPLGTYEHRTDHMWVHVVPFYWHSERPGHEWTFLAPLYLTATDRDLSWRHLFPLISRQRIGDYYARNFILGPVFISTSDAHRDLFQWDLLFPLVHHRKDHDSSRTRVVPLYWSGEDQATGNSYLFVLPFYGSSDSATERYHFLFPFYGYDDNAAVQVRRLTLLGLPPAKGFPDVPSLSLFEQATSADETSHRLFPLYRYTSGADDSSTFDALLLYQHHSAASGTVDRFFPLYRYENDVDGQTREFDLFGHQAASWFRYHVTPSWSEQRLFGVYNYDRGQDDSYQFSVLGYRRLSLYLHRSEEQVTEDRFVPLYEYFRHGDHSSLSLIGMSALSLYRRESSPSLFQHRLFPLYQYRHDIAKSETDFDAVFLYRHLTSPTHVADRLLPFWDYAGATDKTDWRLSVLGMDAQALYRHDRDEVRTLDHLFPFYGYRSEHDGETRFSSLGLPPTGQSAAWALYEHAASSTEVSDRLFPLYQYAHDETSAQTTINALGVEPVSLVRFQTSPTQQAQHVFPLYSYQADHTADTTSFSALWTFWRMTSPTMSQTSLFPLASLSTNENTGESTWSLIGLDPALPISWIRHSLGPDRARGLFLPLYDYHRDGTAHTLSLGGLSHLALYRQERSSAGFSHRLFPLYSYSHDLAHDISRTRILVAYQHEQAPDHAIDTLAPLWHYERRDGQNERRLNALGLGNLSLYEHRATATGITDRVFPLYKYSSDLESGDAEFSLLWPLAEYKSRHGILTSASLLWWLVSYDRPDQTHSDFHFLGASNMALARWMTASTESTFELNPVIPLYRYRSETDRGVSWDLFGGFIGIDSNKDRSRVKLFWILSV